MNIWQKTPLKTALAATAIAAGTPALAQSTSTTLPDCLTNGLAFWVDANKNVTTDGNGNVTAWHDARWTGDDDTEHTLYAKTYSDGTEFDAIPPVLSGYDENKKYVDFGEYGENKWMLWTQNGSDAYQQYVRCYVGVIGFGESAGFLLCDVNKPNAVGIWGVNTSNANPFHKGTANGDGKGDYISAHASAGNSVMEYGETRLNGKRINPLNTKYNRNAWQIFSQNGPAYCLNQATIPYASTFFNQGNFKNGRPAGSNIDRQGGGKIAELLVFNRILTEEERFAAEQYLNRKWGVVAAFENLTAGETVNAATDVLAENITGSGTIVKTGEGKLTVQSGAALGTVALDLREGSVEVVQKRELPPVVLQDGVSIIASEGAARIQGSTDANKVAIGKGISDATITVEDVASSVKEIEVSDITLALRPALSALPEYTETYSDCDNLVKNGGGEEDNRDNWGSLVKQWELVAPENSEWDNAAANIGTAKARSDSPFYSQTFVPEGTHVIYIQGTVTNGKLMQGRMKQTVTVPWSGLYNMTFWVTRRAKKGVCHLNVLANNKTVLHKRIDLRLRAIPNNSANYDDDTVFQKIGFDVLLDKGANDIIFEVGMEETDDRAVIIDDIRLVSKRPGEFVFVPNAGFDSLGEKLKNVGDSNQGFAYATPENAFWTFNKTDNGYSGIGQTPSTWWMELENKVTDDRNFRIGYLAKDSSCWQTLTFPRSGKVRISLRCANRVPNWPNNFAQSALRWRDHSCSVQLDGTEIGSCTVYGRCFTDYAFDVDVSAGEHELKFTGNVPDLSTDRTVIIDDISIQYIDKQAVFGEDAGTWSNESSVEYTATDKGPGVLLAQTASIRKTVTVETAGYYALCFNAQGRPINPSAPRGVCNNWQNYSHKMNILLDGTKFAALRSDSSAPQQFEYRMPYLTAGEHTIDFVGTTDNAAENGATFFTPPQLVALETSSALPNLSSVTLSLSSAKLALDFPGTLKVGKLLVDGEAVYGTINASTHPTLVSGPGSLECSPKGTVIMLI